MTTSRVHQDEVAKRLAWTDGIFEGLRRRNQGPRCYRPDFQDKFHYWPEDVAELEAALRTLGSHGLNIHSAPPLGLFQERPASDIDVFIPAAQAWDRMGVSKKILENWRSKSIGPYCERPNKRDPYRYREADVEEIRSALLTLGKFGMGLPNVPPLGPQLIFPKVR